MCLHYKVHTSCKFKTFLRTLLIFRKLSPSSFPSYDQSSTAHRVRLTRCTYNNWFRRPTILFVNKTNRFISIFVLSRNDFGFYECKMFCDYDSNVNLDSVLFSIAVFATLAKCCISHTNAKRSRTRSTKASSPRWSRWKFSQTRR